MISFRLFVLNTVYETVFLFRISRSDLVSILNGTSSYKMRYKTENSIRQPYEVMILNCNANKLENTWPPVQDQLQLL